MAIRDFRQVIAIIKTKATGQNGHSFAHIAPNLVFGRKRISTSYSNETPR